MEERLQKILSRAGVSSRRGAEKIMQEGRVTVDGEVVRELGSKADLAVHDVRVDGVRLRAPEAPAYLLLNKPKGVVTTRHDPEGRTTVMDLVPSVAGLFPVGRLDVTTEGLILLTNDGAFAERVSHPRYEVPRVYHAKVRGVPDAVTLARLRKGVYVEGERLTADRVRVLSADNNSWIEVTVHEGRHHEVRRLLEAAGHPVSKLRRVAIGPITDRGLEPGAFRPLTPAEVKGLLRGQGPPSGPPAFTRPGPRRRPTTTRPASSERRPRVAADNRPTAVPDRRPSSAAARPPARPGRAHDRRSGPGHRRDGRPPRRPRR